MTRYYRYYIWLDVLNNSRSKPKKFVNFQQIQDAFENDRYADGRKSIAVGTKEELQKSYKIKWQFPEDENET